MSNYGHCAVHVDFGPHGVKFTTFGVAISIYIQLPPFHTHLQPIFYIL